MKTGVGQYISVKPRDVEFHEDELCGSVVVACRDVGRLVNGTVGVLRWWLSYTSSEDRNATVKNCIIISDFIQVMYKQQEQIFRIKFG